jgi:hypothetical protein
MAPELVVGLTGLSILIFSVALYDEGDAGRAWTWGVVAGLGVAVAGFTALALPGSGVPTNVIAAGVGGVVALGTTWLLRRAAAAAERRAAEAAEELRGTLATVTSAIPVGGAGEIAANLQGTPVQLSAVADRPVARGEQVLIVDVVSPTQVRVELGAGPG